MSRLLRFASVAVLLPTIVLSLFLTAVEYGRERFGMAAQAPSPFVAAIMIAAEALFALFIFMSIRRILSPMEIKLTKIKQSADSLSEIVERSSLAVFSFDQDGCLLYANETCRALFGIRVPDTDVSASVPTLFDRLQEASRTKLKEAMKAAYRRGASEVELELMPDAARSAARHADVHLALRPANSQRRGMYYSAVASEVTEKKLLERQYAEAKERERQLDLARSEFLARVSHEIRTPLHAVVNTVSMLDRSDVPEDQKAGLERIELLSRHLLRTVNEFLEFSRLESDQVVLVNEPFHLSAALHNVMHTLEAIGKDKAIRLVVERDPAVPEWLSGDSHRLEQVLINLGGNAVKFTEEGEIRLIAELDASTANEAHVRFIVRDTGIGMTDDQISRLFVPFHQADASISRRYGGSGLGLVIAKRLVELMGGSLKVESEPGTGTEFRFKAIFAKTGLANPLSDRQDRPRTDGPSLGRVLLVDDHDINLTITCRMLESIGASVETAARAKDAIQLLDRQSPFDLILMDLHMPEMDGIAAVRSIRGDPRWRSIPIVMLTADTQMEQHARCYQAGVQQIIAKPIDKQQLRQLLGRWLPAESSDRTSPSPPSLRPMAVRTPRSAQLDVRQALARLNGDRALYLHLLHKLVESYGDVHSKLERLLEEGQWQEAKRILHSLRGASSLLGANGVYEAASQCEEALSHAEESGAPLSPILAERLRVLERELSIDLHSVAEYKPDISRPNKSDIGGDSF
ncbi:PAS domain-containing hybrid sensor histidine kinase/response regulator [Cohnella lubricantis]|uniref:Circadian input-output histidine kinase CikA n=1 Tax=Cohnella lubricantis TaxID=2163172 RepID=A0A841TAU5_9BACL|nr:PAS domain-containing hybrid sensor histidine kinase/response regulator [Cohnella lubricantis]MBB6676147.1 response regulator [Cohnella lubricantis]MBP2118661.1 signal transduction histidine kinase/DNA-binding response OmpR family regulator [Cohnella lubricantis]